MQMKRGPGPGLGELPKICRFPFNKYTMPDFNFGTQLGFAKAHHKITPIGQSGCGLGLGSSQVSDFKIGIPLGFAKAHRKIPHRRKSGRGSGIEERPL